MGKLDGEEFTQMATEYSTRWLGQNLWLERGIPTLLTRGWAIGEEVATDAELMQSEYFQHFLPPADIRHGMGINVQSDIQKASSRPVSCARRWT